MELMKKIKLSTGTDFFPAIRLKLFHRKERGDYLLVINHVQLRSTLFKSIQIQSAPFNPFQLHST